MQFRLTTASFSWVQVILLPQPLELAGITGVYHHAQPLELAGITGVYHHAQLIFLFLVEMGFRHVGQADLELLTSGDLPTLAS